MNAGDLCEMIENDTVDQVDFGRVLKFGPPIHKGELVILLSSYGTQSVRVLSSLGEGCVWRRRIKKVDDP